MRIQILNKATKQNLLEDLLKRSPNSYGQYEESVNAILTAVKEERDAAVGAIETADSYDLFVDLVINRLGYYPKKRTQLIDEKDWAKEN